jgi:hypothetical protein
MEAIHLMRMECSMREIEAFKQFQQVVLADNPELLSKIFAKKDL